MQQPPMGFRLSMSLGWLVRAIGLRPAWPTPMRWRASSRWRILTRHEDRPTCEGRDPFQVSRKTRSHRGLGTEPTGSVPRSRQVFHHGRSGTPVPTLGRAGVSRMVKDLSETHYHFQGLSRVAYLSEFPDTRSFPAF